LRLSKHFGTTLREPPAGVEAASHQLLLRAGFIRQLGQGLFSYLPLAHRSLVKIEDVMREEMNKIGGQEMTMPVVHPAEAWKVTGRWQTVGPEMARFKDRKGRDLVLAMTHEEVVVDLCMTEIRSHRQLPQLIYHIQTKFRDDPRPRAGLIRVREFTMKDSYSLDLDNEGLDKQYRAHYQAYFDIFHRCGIPTIAVGSDVGMMGGSMAHEFMYLTPVGEDTLVLCGKCGYAANRQIARFAKSEPEKEELRPVEKVATPGATTIEDLAKFLDIPGSKTAKAVFLIAGHEEEELTREEFVFAVIRGDMEVNETKVANAVKADWLRPAVDNEIRAVGAEPGYGSPIGLKDVTVLVDEMIPKSPNLVAGANEEGFHLRNTNVPRDYEPNIVADIAAAGDGDSCIDCGSPLYTNRGVEVGNIFKLGTRYSDSVGATYLDDEGKERPIVMGSYGIGSGRLLACVAEEHNDENGLIWPITVAPYQVHLATLNTKDKAVVETGDRVYRMLQDAGIEVLYDDRDERPGVKFADADLIGVPIRLAVSNKTVAKNAVELKRRDKDKKDLEIVEEAMLVERLKNEIQSLTEEIQKTVVEMPFK
jgi:prolyl-tRNA synthetase